ncbi:hypothetical protein SLEP1_g3889 [Rubroshorea leprosula]|uniref:Alpha-carbonic anhydrase domain-containing protein n=1 Tax=Rubroshorea leprosula TaxID=152421 RepID=A0AAV5HWK1_9ROSI|nr:hypothetical protein SLEP1_g3889 [Rubroshorea leprosula]
MKYSCCCSRPTFALIFISFLFLSSSSLLPICIASSSEVGEETPFTYIEGTGKGPNEWGNIRPDWKVCNTGKLQSPIDLLDGRVQVMSNLGKLKRDNKAAPAVVKNRGHGISVWWEGYAGKININETDYKLTQCHWHSPSEHTFNGASASGKTAVIGIVYKYGRPDPLLSRLLHHIKTVGKNERPIGILNPGDIKFGSRKYYRYNGSLTTPPCTEGVVWTIVKKVRTASREQVKALRDAVHDVSASYKWLWYIILHLDVDACLWMQPHMDMRQTRDQHKH